MGEFFLPLLLVSGGIVAAFLTYRGIRRGGARYYTLEREAMLRRAMLTLLLSVLLFLGSIGVLIYRQQSTSGSAAEPENGEAGVVQATITPTMFVEQFPPTATATSSIVEPTATATPVICRAIVEGTSGNGLTLRDVPGGEEITILPDGSVLTVLEDDPVESGGFNWRKVRLVGGDEGWVAEDFLTIRAPCN
ncbi:MAG: SH3 domain-containing protein [Chloroflexota bacterium]